MELIEAAGAEIERVVRLLPSDAWELPTPSEMSVRELVRHVVSGNWFTALLLIGIDRDRARAGSVAGDPLGLDPLFAVINSTRQQADCFAAAAPGLILPGPQGDVTVEAFLRFRLIDLVVHGWDLLRAAGLDETLDASLVDDLAVLVEPHLEELLATGAYGDGPSGTVGPDASPQARLLDQFGRRV